MNGKQLLGSGALETEGNIYADKSSLVLDWLLGQGLDRDAFALREVARACNVSAGLVQRVFRALVYHGFLHTGGVRTAKNFRLKRPIHLLRSWTDNYSIVKRCKRWTYHSGLAGLDDMMAVMQDSGVTKHVALALHSAAAAYGCRNTNLQTLELYLLDPSLRPEIEEMLLIEPQERGYEVLLIQPYYKSLLKQGIDPSRDVQLSSPLLTYLDLYHFPLRGREQADYLADRLEPMKSFRGRK